MPARSLDQTLLALADPTRRGVIDLLRRHPQRASELAEQLGMSRPAMSRHLKLLRKTGLVSENELEEDARVRMYQLEQRPFTELSAWLTDVAAFWSDQLRAFKLHAEKPKKRR